MARTSIATDAFTYSNGVLESVAGGNWTNLRPSTNDVSVSSNAVVNSGFSTISNYRWDGTGSFTADQYAKITLTTINWTSTPNVKLGVSVRFASDTDANRDGYYAYIQDESGTVHTKIDKVVNGTATNLSDATGDGFANGDTIELEAEGTTLRVFKNGVELRSVSDSDIGGSSSHKPGLSMSDTAALSVMDSWEGGNITGSSGTAALLTSASTAANGTTGVNSIVPL
jgi:hypothetical protein